MFLPIIGMEIHVEPITKSKMFCECPAEHFRQPANTHSCAVCLGLPGALPIPNQTAIDLCLKLGLALNSQINQRSKFDRKNYFYPDLSKSYQISQYDLPFCYLGSFTFPEIDLKTQQSKTQTVKITRIHMEEDTGKLIHDTVGGQKVSLIDYNRSGVPLIEIVTEPDLHSPSDTKQFLKWLARTIQFLGISDCDMEKGTMRLEANISVAQVGDLSDPSVISSFPDKYELPSYKVEVKNVNSFRYIERAIEIEIDRHIALLKQGQTPVQETRGYSEDRGTTFSQRVKETAKDYRYFPDPDIPPIHVTDDQVSRLHNLITETPATAFQKLTTEHAVRPDFTEIILDSLQSYIAFLEIIPQLPSPLTPNDAAKLIINQKLDLAQTPIPEIISILKNSIKSYSLTGDQLIQIIDQVLADNPQQVATYKSGKTGILGFLVGQVAKLAKGQADPKEINQLILQKLN